MVKKMSLENDYLLYEVCIDMSVNVVPDLEEDEPVTHAHLVAAHSDVIWLGHQRLFITF